MSWTVRYIRPDDLPQVWPLAMPLLAPAVERSEGRYDLRAVHDRLRQKQSLLWLVRTGTDVAAAFTTRDAVYPRATYLCVDFLGGDRLSEWVATADQVLTEYAAEAGFAGVEMLGRPGWLRTLDPFGWKQNAVMLTKPVSASARERAA